MELVLYHPRIQNLNLITLFLFLIICASIKTPNTDALKYLPLLVRMNIMEDRATRELAKVRKKMKELLPDIFSQMWLGTFDYMFCGHKIVGTIELKCTKVFSVAENKAWLYSDTSNVQAIVRHLAKHRITEIPGWDYNITCSIQLNDSHMTRYLFIPHDILTERHSQNIKWEKKLVA